MPPSSIWKKLTMWALMAAAWLAPGPGASAAIDQEIPSTLAPFATLIGSWKGTGIPTANRLRGWQERHSWAWKFARGRPIGLTLTMEGNKALKAGELTHDADAGAYRLIGSDAEDKAVTYAGTFDDSGKILTLARQGPGGDADRLVIRLLDNGIRYLVWIESKPKGAPLPSRVVEVGLTKVGEAFAAGGTAASGPKCVVTGGASSLSMTYQGKTYPLCCSGCRDEFLENPAKYVEKAARLGLAEVPKAADPPPAEAAKPDATPAPTKPANPPAKRAGPSAAPASKVEAPDPGVKADSLMRIASSFEKSKKSAQALQYYRRVVAEHPGTPQAKAAGDRIKALEPDRP